MSSSSLFTPSYSTNASASTSRTESPASFMFGTKPSSRKRMPDPIVVIGGSYAGAHAAQVLAKSLPEDQRIILLEQRSHMAHLYVLPRFAVISGYENQAFIPYCDLFDVPFPNPSVPQAHSTAVSTGPTKPEQAQHLPSEEVEGDVQVPDSPYSTTSSLDDEIFSGAASATSARTNSTDLTSFSLDPNGEPFLDEIKAKMTLEADRLRLEEEEEELLRRAGLELHTRAQYIQATVTKISKRRITYTTTTPTSLEAGAPSTEPTEHQIPYSYLIYAAGSRLPHPLISLPKKKMEAGEWLKANQQKVKGSKKVMVVGGGALGIQFASDIKSVYPEKHVTLVVSRSRFMHSYPEEMHNRIAAEMEALGVETIFNDRLVSVEELEKQREQKADGETISVTLRSGRVVESDLQILAVGQRHNHELISTMEPSVLSSKGSIKVRPSLQLDHPDYPHIFTIGDVADTAAIKAGHTGYFQADVAVANLVKLIESKKTGVEAELKDYVPGKPQIKVTVGLSKAVNQGLDADGNFVWTTVDNVPDNLNASGMWKAYGADPEDLTV